MRTWYHSWVAAIRIARRDAWRSKGRSFLVLAMIALPILGVSAADITLRSSDVSPEQRLDRSLGRADAVLSGTGMGNTPIHQKPDGNGLAPADGDEDKAVPNSPTDIRAAVPRGAEVLRDSSGTGRFRTRHGILNATVHELDALHPMAAGRQTVVRGRFPAKAGEVAATTRFLEDSGLYVGSRLVPRGMEGTEYRIVGAYELPSELKTYEVLAPPGTLLPPLERALKANGMPGADVTNEYYVRVGGEGFTWNMVKAANAKGVVVVSRAVVLDPPADSDVPLYQHENSDAYTSGGGGVDKAALAAGATVVVLAMLEICLLAGPAFAVGARRSRRQLGLVGANGGDRRHIRAIVLSGGLVIGFAAAVTGIVLSVALTLALRPVLESALGERWGGFRLLPHELLGIALLAVVTGLLAAVVPAVTASRQTVLASLTGRRGVRRASRVLPVVGLVAIGIGAPIALFGSVQDNNGYLYVAGGSALAELGVVALTPVLVGLFGRAGRWLPLSPRLALRDAVRNRGRTAPAVAAVLAAVAGTVAVATYAQSNDAQARQQYVAQMPDRSGTVTISEAGGHRQVPAVRAALEKELPVAVRADLDRIVVGRKDCELWSDAPGCGQVELTTPKENECPLHAVPDPTTSFSKAERRRLAKDWRCLSSESYAPQEFVVADEKLLTTLAVRDPAAARALQEGRSVAFDRRHVKDGRITLKLITDPAKARETPEGQEVPGIRKSFAVHLSTANAYGLRVVIPPAAAKAAGLQTAAYGSYFTLDRLPTSEERQRYDAAVDRIGASPEFRIENGYQGENDIELLALAVFAGLVTIGAAGIATGLAQADAEADLKTLAAVGAAPRIRRSLSGFQCGLVALMGVGLGSAAGVLPGVGLRLAERREYLSRYEQSLSDGWSDPGGVPHVPVVIPWETLGALVVLIPLGAALLAALVTRSSGALARRAA
ncbi:FtsX-like permease family protein [Streptomyces sp. NPDC086023]|uniref:FtsX-like permease family protein n=1 Tax=Streptomyces sp. NPDC086023 TaxID=3365746 RepID=UPI0037D8FADA